MSVSICNQGSITVSLKEISYTRQGPVMHPAPRGMTRLYNPNQIHLKIAYKADGCTVSH